MPIDILKSSKNIDRNQPAYSVAAELQKKDPKEVRKKLDKDMENFTKMIVAMFKNQDPTNQDGNDMCQTVATVTAAIAQMNAINHNSDLLEKIAENTKNSDVTKGADALGKIAYYDDGTKEFTGSPVEFNYQIKRPVRVSNDTRLSVRIEISNSEGKVVFRGRGTDRQGENNFIWNGRNEAGVIQPNGNYVLKVSATNNANKSAVIGATTSSSGIIEAVEARHYIINGKKIEKNLITKIENSTQKSNNNPNDYINAIGKQAEVDLSLIEAKNGKAQVTFNNNIEKPGKLRVVLLDKDSRIIKSINSPDLVQKGTNNITINTRAEGINDGEYKCKIYVKDEATDKEVLLDNTVKVEVTGIDLVNKQFITADGQKFNTSNLMNITSNNINDNSLLTQSGYYIGKNVKFEEPDFTYDGLSIPTNINLNMIESDRKISEVRLNIFRGQDLVASITRNGNELIETVPSYDDLDANSKTIVDKVMKSSNGGTDINYIDLDINQKALVDNFIVNKFRGGVLFKDGQDTNLQSVKDKNSGIAVYDWAGELNNGHYANIGEVYRREWAVTTSALGDGSDDRTDKSKITFVGTVKQTRVEDGQIKLVLNDERVVDLSNAEIISSAGII